MLSPNLGVLQCLGTLYHEGNQGKAFSIAPEEPKFDLVISNGQELNRLQNPQTGYASAFRDDERQCYPEALNILTSG